MNRLLIGAFGTFVLMGIGLFWMQGRAQVEEGAPPPIIGEIPSEPEIDPNALPTSDATDIEGPAPPEATEATKEQKRFGRYDRNRDESISRNEMLSSRTDAFRKLDVDGNNLLTFEEWAVTTVNRFDGMDANSNAKLTPAEFATSKPKPKAKKKASCRC